MQISQNSIDPIDLINLSKDVAQLNLGYLVVCVTIFVILGGAFAYFNIKPMREALDKQDADIKDVKKEVVELIEKNKDDISGDLKIFKEDVIVAIQTELDKFKLENKNEMSLVEKNLLEKIESVSDAKDLDLKELLLSEVSNKMGLLEKSITANISDLKTSLTADDVKINKVVGSIKSDVKDMNRILKELQAYKYGQEGKMGSIIYSIELLKEDITEKDFYDWRIPERLENLKKYIKGITLDSGYITQIEEQLVRIESEGKYNILIKEVRDEYVVKKVD